MTQEEIEKNEALKVKSILRRKGYMVDLYVIEAVLDAYGDYVQDEMPPIDSDEVNAYIIDELAFDPEIKQEITPDLLDKIADAHVAFLVDKGIVPEDWEEEE